VSVASIGMADLKALRPYLQLHDDFLLQVEQAVLRVLSPLVPTCTEGAMRFWIL
jgi:hypothetical protein